VNGCGKCPHHDSIPGPSELCVRQEQKCCLDELRLITCGTVLRVLSAVITRRNAAVGRKKLLYLSKSSRNRLVRYMLCCFVFATLLPFPVVLRFAPPPLASGLGCEITTYVG
jgi:hypothetical protein